MTINYEWKSIRLVVSELDFYAEIPGSMFFFFRTRKLTELVTEDTNNLETPISINNDDKVIVQPKVLGKKKQPLNQI